MPILTFVAALTGAAAASQTTFCGEALEEAGLPEESVRVEVEVLAHERVLGVVLDDEQGLFFVRAPLVLSDPDRWLDGVLLPGESFFGWAIDAGTISISPVPVPGS